MTIDVFVLQIMISGEIQAVNIGNTRLVPGFPQGSNSLEKASALGARDVFASKNGNDLPKKACPDPGSNYVEKRGELAS